MERIQTANVRSEDEAGNSAEGAADAGGIVIEASGLVAEEAADASCGSAEKSDRRVTRRNS